MDKLSQEKLQRIDECRKSGDYATIWDIYDINDIDFWEVFNEIPDNEWKYNLVVDRYTHKGLHNRDKYLNAIKPFIPAEETEHINELADQEGNITIYHGGTKTENPALRVSWTIDIDIAEYFAKRCLSTRDSVIYKGYIKPKDVIAYVQYGNGWNEKEVVQLNNVTNIEVFRECKQSEYDSSIHDDK